jgi:hypothetical protein
VLGRNRFSAREVDQTIHLAPQHLGAVFHFGSAAFWYGRDKLVGIKVCARSCVLPPSVVIAVFPQWSLPVLVIVLVATHRLGRGTQKPEREQADNINKEFWRF